MVAAGVWPQNQVRQSSRGLAAEGEGDCTPLRAVLRIAGLQGQHPCHKALALCRFELDQPFGGVANTPEFNLNWVNLLGELQIQ